VPSFLATSLSTAVELLEYHVDAAAANEVCWGTQSSLVATLSHFSELGAELGLLGSRNNMDLPEDQVDTRWIQVRPTSDLLVSYVLPSIALDSSNGTGE
jgi:hypothetical protein